MKNIVILLFITIFVTSCWKPTNLQENTNQVKKWETNLSTNENKEVKAYKYEQWDVVAIMKTTNGTISILLETELVPRTTANFIGLATKWYYDDVIFHRIIKWFMIQWGDPDGTGMWGESIYWEKFDDEFSDELKNNKYTISMANAWKNTNGSQFFINTKDNNFLDGKHSVFGEVVEWLDNVDKLEKTKTDWGDKPLKEVKMISIDIKEYDNGKLKDYNFDLDSILKKVEDTKKTENEAKKDKVLKNWDSVSVHYTLTLEDWTKKDSSLDRGEPFVFVLWNKMVIKGWDEWLLGHKIGDKFKLEVSP